MALATSATAFTIVKYLGAAYLIWLGVRRLTARQEEGEAVEVPVAGRILWLVLQPAPSRMDSVGSIAEWRQTHTRASVPRGKRVRLSAIVPFSTRV